MWSGCNCCSSISLGISSVVKQLQVEGTGLISENADNDFICINKYRVEMSNDLFYGRIILGISPQNYFQL